MIYLAIPILLLFGLLALQDFLLGMLLFIMLLPSYLFRFSIMGVPTTLLEGMVLILIVLWFSRLRKRFTSLPFKQIRFFAIPITLLLIAICVGFIISPDKPAALGVFKAYYIEPVLFFFILLDTLRQPKAKEKIIRALGISSLIVSSVGIIQWVFNIGIPIPWDIERRVTSVFEYPNALALFVGPLIVLACFEFFREQSRNWKLFWLVVSTLGLVAIFLAQSEASWIAIIATFFLATLSVRSTRKYGIAIASFFLVCIALISPLQNYAIEKMSLSDSSGQVRISQWTETIELLKDHPLLGAGLSGYPIALKPYHKATHLEIFQYPHNFILNIWVELGLLGLIAFGLMAYKFIQLFITEYTRDGHDRPLRDMNPIPFIFFEMAVHGLVDVPYFKNDLSILTWILLALFISEYVRTKNTPSKTKALG